MKTAKPFASKEDTKTRKKTCSFSLSPKEKMTAHSTVSKKLQYILECSSAVSWSDKTKGDKMKKEKQEKKKEVGGRWGRFISAS